LVDEAAAEMGWGDQRLAFEIGVLPSGRIINATQTGRMRRGERRQITGELVERSAVVLPKLSRERLWAAALMDTFGLNEEAAKSAAKAIVESRPQTAAEAAVPPGDGDQQDPLMRTSSFLTVRGRQPSRRVARWARRFALAHPDPQAAW